MVLALVDWLIIVILFVILLGTGLLLRERAGKNTGEFFLSGRKLPWYIAGTSMVATTFAADTPLAVTELVAENGIAGNWLWWNMLIGGMLTVFFFARLWRRAGILTDCEFVTIRYSGRAANFLRGFRAIYIGIFMNVIVIAWVNLAMVKIISVLFPDITFLGYQVIAFPGFTLSAELLWVGVIMLMIAVYSALSGLWGISFTDTFQFILAMTGCIILAVYAVNSVEVGGIEGLKAQLPDFVLKFTPRVGQTEAANVTGLLKLGTLTFITYIGVQWWASWYPGAEPGGGGYVAQRMMSAKDEKNSLLATLWFQVAHYALRPWPWVIAALCTLILYPELPPEQKGEGFVMMIRDLLPAGLKGLLIASFLAAYMSTIASQTVWGTSYIVNDFYRPFISPRSDEKSYVKVSRFTTIILLFFSLLVTSKLEKISDAWRFILECSGGIGMVLILRWFWWRINAWSEIAALIAPFLIYPFLKLIGIEFPNTLLIIIAWSSVIWVTVTFLTRPTNNEVLRKFYRKVHPGGPGWKRIASKEPDVQGDSGYLLLFINWIAGSLMVITALFSIGKLILHDYSYSLLFAIIALLCGYVIYRNMKKIGWEQVTK